MPAGASRCQPPPRSPRLATDGARGIDGHFPIPITIRRSAVAAVETVVPLPPDAPMGSSLTAGPNNLARRLRHEVDPGNVVRDFAG
jgi:hypothetical protein